MPSFQELLSDKTRYPDETKITGPDGVETSLGEVRKGHLMESDYRRKTTAVSEERRRLEEERREFEASRIEAERKLEELAAQVVGTKGAGKTAEEDEIAQALQANPVARALATQIQQLGSKLGEIEKATGTLSQELVANRRGMMVAEHRKVLDEIKSRDKNLDEAELIGFAKSNYVPRLDLAYRLMTEEKRLADAVKAAEEKARQAGIEEGKRAAIAPTLPQRTRLFVQDLPKDQPTTFDSAADAAAQDPEIIGLLTSQGV